MQILFICTGNTCRSSMAEALAKQWLIENGGGRTDIRVISAGLAAWPGSPASPQAIAAMKEAGVDLSGHKATAFSKELVDQSDIILTMTDSHKKTIVDRYPDSAAKVFSLAEFVGESDGRDVQDPFGQPLEVYRACATEIKELVGAALNKILKQMEKQQAEGIF